MLTGNRKQELDALVRCRWPAVRPGDVELVSQGVGGGKPTHPSSFMLLILIVSLTVNSISPAKWSVESGECKGVLLHAVSMICGDHPYLAPR